MAPWDVGRSVGSWHVHYPKGRVQHFVKLNKPILFLAEDQYYSHVYMVNLKLQLDWKQGITKLDSVHGNK